MRGFANTLSVRLHDLTVHDTASSLENPSTSCTLALVARERTITKLELIPATVSGQRGWVHARWERSDGSEGEAEAYFRPQTATRWYIARLQITKPTVQLLHDVPLARIASAVNADPKIREWVEQGTGEETVKRMRRPASRRVELEEPPGRRLDEPFLQRVADAYRTAVAHGLPPAKTLAVDSERPISTVNRWIAAARSRGYLPPAEPGKVSA
jgi:hypothetical protein